MKSLLGALGALAYVLLVVVGYSLLISAFAIFVSAAVSALFSAPGLFFAALGAAGLGLLKLAELSLRN
jgi:hypothetical protein